MPATTLPSDRDLLRALKRGFGYTSFKPNQHEIIRAILEGRDVFAALPTGGGKSLCYQLPAIVREGLTLVVSPLISLMKDQVDSAREEGIPAAYLNSSLGEEEARATWRELAAGRIRLLYASPERLSLAGFRSALTRFRITLVAVDEAHCISEWGHEFRPDYRSLGLLRQEFPGVPVAAFTATATRAVQDDIVRLLGLSSPFIVRASFDRPEIFYRVAAKVGDADEQVLDFISRHPGQSGIVYRGTRKSVERTASSLAARRLSAVAYHAGLEDEQRRERQEAFVRDEVSVVVATIAFGMGIDKPNVRWVVHADLPRSVEGYYQETGRAARDGEPAETLLLYGHRRGAVAHREDGISGGAAPGRSPAGRDPALRGIGGLPARPAAGALRREPSGKLRPLRCLHGRGGDRGSQRGCPHGSLRCRAHGGALRSPSSC